MRYSRGNPWTAKKKVVTEFLYLDTGEGARSKTEGIGLSSKVHNMIALLCVRLSSERHPLDLVGRGPAHA